MHDALSDVETETKISIGAGSAGHCFPALHRAEDTVQMLGRNRLAAVVNGDHCVALIVRHIDGHRCACGSVLYRIPDDVRQRLTDSSAVPFTALPSSRIEFDGPVRPGSGDFGHHVMDCLLHAHVGEHYRDAAAKAAPREVQKITDHLLHASRAAPDARGEREMWLLQLLR